MDDCLERDERQTNATSWSDSRATTTTPTAPGSTQTCTWHWSGLASTSLEAKLDRVKRPFSFFRCLPSANPGIRLRNINVLVAATKKKMWRQWRQSVPSTLPKYSCDAFWLLYPETCLLLFSFNFQTVAALTTGCFPVKPGSFYCGPANCYTSATGARCLAQVHP